VPLSGRQLLSETIYYFIIIFLYTYVIKLLNPFKSHDQDKSNKNRITSTKIKQRIQMLQNHLIFSHTYNNTQKFNHQLKPSSRHKAIKLKHTHPQEHLNIHKL